MLFNRLIATTNTPTFFNTQNQNLSKHEADIQIKVFYKMLTGHFNRLIATTNTPLTHTQNQTLSKHEADIQNKLFCNMTYWTLWSIDDI